MITIRDILIILLFVAIGCLVYSDYKSDQELQSIIEDSSRTRDSLRSVRDYILTLEESYDQQQELKDSLYQVTIDSLYVEQEKILVRINKYRRDVKNLETNFRPVDLPEF